MLWVKSMDGALRFTGTQGASPFTDMFGTHAAAIPFLLSALFRRSPRKHRKSSAHAALLSFLRALPGAVARTILWGEPWMCKETLAASTPIWQVGRADTRQTMDVPQVARMSTSATIPADRSGACASHTAFDTRAGNITALRTPASKIAA
jgi:hypothetical protein